jgi:hypothetical protein
MVLDEVVFLHRRHPQPRIYDVWSDCSLLANLCGSGGIITWKSRLAAVPHLLGTLFWPRKLGLRDLKGQILKKTLALRAKGCYHPGLSFWCLVDP